jgi:mRNA interferase HigB
MRVHLIRRASLEEYGLRHPLSRNALQELTVKLKYANWNIPIDITATFPDADILGKGSSRVILNINGNRYRLICKYKFGFKQVHLFVCWIGSHPEYDFICSTGRQYTINIF